MLRLKDQFYQPIDERMRRLFWDIYFKPLIELVDIPMPRLNSADNAILAAIRSGQIQYKGGVFFGQFNARISQQLSKFAIFDSRSKTWKGQAPASVIGASIIAEGKRKDLMARMDFALDAAERNINDALASLSLGDSLPLPLMREAVIKDLWSVGVQPHLSERAEAKLRKDYTDNMKLNIVDENNPDKSWNRQQVTRLREMIQRIQTTSDNSSIRELIQSEWNTSASKAKFLARQETGLFFEAYGRQGAKSAGVRRYRWSGAKDIRERPRHRELEGTIVDLDSEGLIVDIKTGRRAHAGQDFQCRCGKIWVLD